MNKKHPLRQYSVALIILTALVLSAFGFIADRIVLEQTGAFKLGMVGAIAGACVAIALAVYAKQKKNLE